MDAIEKTDTLDTFLIHHGIFDSVPKSTKEPFK